ncbi:hypothetical protein [Bartonella apis]|uniref:hypothetical protein n=1 Tax=Bartonella apis TaxID=1686310 RepID=UPI0026EEB179|nr:hypothetical protein [Bartonella apis]
MVISILLANKTIPTIRSSANIGSIIMDMPATIDEKETAIATATDHSCFSDLVAHVERIRWAILDIVFFEVGDAQNGAFQYRRKEQF